MLLAHGKPNREQIALTVLADKVCELSEALMNSVALVCLEPLGQTPEYLDPQSQEALHEVDISGMALHFSFDQHQREKPPGVLEGGTVSNR